MKLIHEATDFLTQLQREFGPSRERLLQRRYERQEKIRAGELPDFLTETADVRQADWRVGPCPKDLEDRRVEITGPAEAKMIINALNSEAKVFMADFEDSLSPTWENIQGGQQALFEAVRRTLTFTAPDGAKSYRLNEHLATLVVRPRGWHLEERHFKVDGKPISASLFDFGVFFFHNAQELLRRGSGPYFYLPKIENHREARLWNEVFNFAQDQLKIPRGSIRATVLIETILAAFEMDEILHELKDHAAGLNAGRWDYIFSYIKKFAHDGNRILPDRSQITMGVPFMKAYAELLVKTCHRREAHAMGGMSAFIPNRKDPEVTEKALAKVTEDKRREAQQGFDGTWVAHPDLAPVAKQQFDLVLGRGPHQKTQKREDVTANTTTLLSPSVPGGKITEAGVRSNINVALQYLERWLSGVGAAAIHNLMEDAATAEISRAQLWQWIKHRARLDDDRAMSEEIYIGIRNTELHALGGEGAGRYADAARILDGLVLAPEFAEFLTLPAYERL